ncbi:MAG: phosphotyrosine protein phosphatase, partial [Alphaproteobacteria bacterium HGW-Alphaproteobacteria-10]
CGASLGLLLDYAEGPMASRDVPDPYYGDYEAFERAMALIESGVAGLVPHLRAMAACADARSAPA